MKNFKKIFFYGFILLLSQNMVAKSESFSLIEKANKSNLNFFENVLLDTIIPSDDEDSIFIEVDEMPQFAGCEDWDFPNQEEYTKCSEEKMMRFIFRGLNYPRKARKKGMQGIVVIQFVVEKNGEITNAKILKDPGGGCGEEALRVVKSMPTWIPGKQNGEVVRVQYTLPVRFKLENGNKKKKDNSNAGIMVEEDMDKKKKVPSQMPQQGEDMPRFPGCEEMGITDSNKLKLCAEEKMLEFVYGNLKYPEAAREEELEGRVIMQFLVEKDGSITNVKILRDQLGYGCGEEAKRIVESMPKWIPGISNGEPVEVQYTFPVRFKL